MEENLSSPSLNLTVERSLATFVNQQGSQKMYSLLDCTEMLRQYSLVNLGEEDTINFINEELKKVQFSKVKNYKRLDIYLRKIRKCLNDCQLLYEDMKNFKKPSDKRKARREIAKTTSPFQVELYFIFMVLLKVSGLQNKTIGRELLRTTPEESKTNVSSFERKRVEEKT